MSQVIYVISAETTNGPFFSSLDKALAYMREDGDYTEEQIQEMVEGKHCDIFIRPVTLDDTDVSNVFDG
jgi:hypothetical protein